MTDAFGIQDLHQVLDLKYTETNGASIVLFHRILIRSFHVPRGAPLPSQFQKTTKKTKKKKQKKRERGTWVLVPTYLKFGLIG